MQGKLNVYKASAGSGKTFTLTCDYIALLLAHEAKACAEAYKHILAVTFTNKATTEMKQRILQHLYGIAHGLKDSEEMLQAVSTKLPEVTIEALRERAKVAIGSILHGYDRFGVTTIDSFFQTLLTNLAHELGLSANFRIDLGDKEALHEAVKRLINQATSGSKEFKWLFDYIGGRMEDGERWDVTHETEDFAENLLKAEYLCKEEELGEKLGNDEFMAVYRKMLNTWEKAAKNDLTAKATALEAAITHGGRDYSAFKNHKTLKNFIAICIKWDEKKKPSATVCLMAQDCKAWHKQSKGSQPCASAEETEALREQLAALIDLWEKSSFTINSCTLSKKMLNPMRLLAQIDELLKEVNRENNRFLLASTPILFQKLVGSIDAPFVFEKAGLRYDHIMIDEFQDTSRLQWGNFKKLFIENLASGGDCMLVGDIKQSIYRWRGGDWKILGCIDSELPGLPLNIRTLDHNYRSEAKIIAFNNMLFPKLADKLKLDEIYCDVEQKVSSKKSKRNWGYVRLRIDKKVRGEKADAENGQEARMLDDLGEQIKRLRTLGVDYNDMAILVRTNKEGAKIIAHFESKEPFADIPLVSEEAYLLSASPAVQALIHTLKWLLNENDCIALNYVARHCATHLNHIDFKWGLTNEELTAYLPDVLREKREEIREKPLYELCELLLAALGLNDIEGQKAYLFSFLDYLLKFLDDHASGLEDFLAFWSESLSRKSVQAGGMNGIRILTIHKSKGLDFHTVFLPYHDWKLEPSPQQKPYVWCEPKAEGYNAMPLLPIKHVSAAENSIYKDDYLQELRQMHVENLNLMYVAFTRATSNLLIWSGCQKSKEENEKISDIGTLLLSAFEEESTMDDEDTLLLKEIGEPLPSQEIEVQSNDKVQDQASEAKTKNPFDPEQDVAISQKVDLQAGERGVKFVQSKASLLLQNEDEETEEEETEFMKRGTLLHNILAQMETAADLENAFRQASAEGWLESKKSEAEARKIITEALSMEAAGEWFDGSWTTFNECSIDSGKLGGTYRPDRVMMKDGECVVVDYKFGKPLTKHKSQVTIYMSLLRQMGYPSVKGYLWYPMLKKIVEL